MPEFDLKDVIAGDEAAINAFVREYSPLFCSVVKRVLGGQTWGNRQEDLVQDIFLALFEDTEVPFRALRAWRPDGGASLRSFLWRFARFRICDRLRTRSFSGKGSRLVSTEELIRLAGSDPEELWRMIQREECAAVIKVAQQSLSESELRFFEESFIENRSVEELAKRWNKSEGAIHQMRTRVRQALISAYDRALLDKKSGG